MSQADHEREPGHRPARQQQHGGRQQHPDRQPPPTKPEQPQQEKENLPTRERADHRPPRGGGGRQERAERGARGRERQQQNRGAGGRSAAQRRDQPQQQSEHPHAPGRPTLGYVELEDIDSSSDWEKESEEHLKQIQAQHDDRSKSRQQQLSNVHDGSKPLQAPPPRQTSEREAGKTDAEQPLQHTGTGSSQRKPSRDDHHESREREAAKPSTGREPRRGAGRGKGQTEEARREGRQKERGNQRRPGGPRGGPREGAQAEPRGTRTAGDGSSMPAGEPVESSSNKARPKPLTDKKAESVSAAEHKTAEFEKYDLNCMRIAIVDNIGSHHIDDEPLSPSVDAEFTEVKSKKDKRERHKKEKEEQQKMEEQQKLEEERQRKSQKAQKFPRQADKAPPVPPTSAWGSSTQKSIPDTLQGGTWSTTATTATTWSSTLSSSNAAPGSHLKAAPITQGWQPSAIPPSSLLPDPLPPGGVSVPSSEWGILGGIHVTPVFPSTSGAGSMLDAAVVSKLTEETAQQLGGVTGEEHSAAPNLASSSGNMPSAIGSDSLDRKSHKKSGGVDGGEGSGVGSGAAALKTGGEKEGRGVKEQQRKDRAESDLTSRKNVPPRMQSSRAHQSGPGRGRGAGRSGGGDKREKDRAVGGNRSDKVRIVGRCEAYSSVLFCVCVFQNYTCC